MNYFDDIEFVHVCRKISSKDSHDSITLRNWGIGIISGHGSVKRIIGNRQVQLKMPFVYLVSPGDHTGWQAVNGIPRDNRWFIIRGARAERMVTALKDLQKGELPVFTLTRYLELIMIHERMLSLWQHSVPSRFYQLAMCAEEFVGTIYNLLHLENRETALYQLITEITEEICEHPELNFNFKRIAHQRHLSYDYFRRCFQKFSGMPINHFLLKKRLEMALSLLRNSADSIKEITDRCGFPRQAEFARFIKQKTGFTPSEIRRQPTWESEG